MVTGNDFFFNFYPRNGVIFFLSDLPPTIALVLLTGNNEGIRTLLGIVLVTQEATSGIH